MAANADYFQSALSRAESNRILLTKVSAIPFSNNRDRTKIIESAREVQSRIQSNLAQLAIEKPKSWRPAIKALDGDFILLEYTLESLWSSPLSSHLRDSTHINRPPDN